MNAPKVFLSHASEDKERFVLAFATALRASGLDAWVDRWEMLPGDSIVKKIFTEGIDQAAAVVVVISTNSISKRWVQEELDAAVVKRINEESRLIPVVLDGLPAEQVPAPIRHLLWVSVPDLIEIDQAAREVVNAVFGVHDKPAVGTPPAYVTSEERHVPSLGRVDSLVLKAAGDEAVRDCGELFRTGEFLASVQALGVDESTLIESLEVLDHDGHIRLHRTMGQGLPSMSSFTLTTHGLEEYLKTYVDGYERIMGDICAAVANMQQGNDADVAKTTGHPRLIVLHVLRRLANSSLIHMSEPHGPRAYFHGVSPKLKRMLSDES